MIVYFIIGALLILILTIWVEFQKQHKNLNKEIIKLKSEKRSLETTYGYAIENMAPYLTELGDEYNPKKLRQLGQPIDYLYFGDEYIEIIEIKTGNSKLNQSQRRIKEQIKQGKVKFRELRIAR